MSDEFVHASIEPLLIDYAAGTLDADDRKKVEVHVLGCEACSRALDEWQQIAAAARANPAPRDLPALDWRLIKGDKPMIAVQNRVAVPRPVSHLRFALPVMFATLAVGASMLFNLMGGAPQPGNNYASAPMLQSETETATPAPQPTEPPMTSTPMPFDGQGTPLLVNGFIIQAMPPDVRPVIVALRPIENGAVIKPQDLTVYLIDMNTLPEGSQFDPDAITYQIARHNIACGQILTLDMAVGNAREVAADQPVPESLECPLELAHTYRPNGGSASRDYDAALYPLPVGVSVEVVVFNHALEAGSVITEADVTVVSNYPPVLMPLEALTTLDGVVGQTLAAPVSSGQVAVPLSFSAEAGE